MRGGTLDLNHSVKRFRMGVHGYLISTNTRDFGSGQGAVHEQTGCGLSHVGYSDKATRNTSETICIS